MKRLLFVDDEVRVLDGLRRMLYPHRREWSMQFVDSGAQAIKLLEQEPFDVIISDMRMPQMDGAELLQRAINIRPDIARLILSGQCDHATVLRAVGPAHQFLTKPCDARILQGTIQRVCRCREMLADSQAAARAAAVQSLYSPPQRLIHLKEALQKNDVPAAGRIVANDVALSAKAIQLISSSFFGTPQHTADPAFAVDLLGPELLLSLLELPEGFAQPAPPSLAAQVDCIHLRSLEKACAAAEAVQSRGGSANEVARAYLANLLSGIGPLLALPAISSKTADLPVEETASIPVDADEAERAGAYLLSLWGIPEEVLSTGGSVGGSTGNSSDGQCRTQSTPAACPSPMHSIAENAGNAMPPIELPSESAERTVMPT